MKMAKAFNRTDRTDQADPSDQQQSREPWSPTELRRFWVLARKCGLDKEAVHGMITRTCPGKDRLHDLTRAEFLGLLNDLAVKQGGQTISELDAMFRGTPIELQWAKIRWLQRRLAWSDQHLINYIEWHGKRTDSRIDHIRWLTVDKARGVIVGMSKMLRRKAI